MPLLSVRSSGRRWARWCRRVPRPAPPHLFSPTPRVPSWQVPSEEVREHIRSQLLAEVEGPFRRYIQELEKELDEFKRCLCVCVCACVRV